MLIEVKVPQLSESVAEATLVSWHKKEGEAVARDENLIDIETDKVVLELPAPDSGVLVKIIKGNGESVASGDVIAQIDTEAKAGAAAPAAEKKAEAPAAKAAPAPAAATAGPAARKAMAEKGIDATSIAGSGDDHPRLAAGALGPVHCRLFSASSQRPPSVRRLGC